MKTHEIENQRRKNGGKRANTDFVAPSDEVLVHHTLGFFTANGMGDERDLAFALPGRCLLPEVSKGCQRELWPLPKSLYQPRTGGVEHERFAASGTLHEWKRMVRSVRNEPWFVFAICAVLTNPFMEFTDLEHLAVNVYGPSCTGKTLGLQLAVSAWGRPISEQRLGPHTSLIENLDAEASGCEIVADTFGSIVIARDELMNGGLGNLCQSESDDENSQFHINRLLPLGRTSSLTLSCSRRPLALSFEKAGRWGSGHSESVHVMDLAIGHLAFESFMTPRQKRKAASELPMRLRERFGTAGPALIQAVLNRFKTATALRCFLDYEVANAHGLLLDDLEQQFPKARARSYEELTPRRIEALRHLAAVYAVGMLGIDMGVLPFYEDDIVRAVCTAREAWLDGLSPVIEGYEDLENVRDYLWRFRQRGYYSSRV